MSVRVRYDLKIILVICMLVKKYFFAVHGFILVRTSMLCAHDIDAQRESRHSDKPASSVLYLTQCFACAAWPEHDREIFFEIK